MQTRVNYANGTYSIIELSKIISQKNDTLITLKQTISSINYCKGKESGELITKDNNQKSITYRYLLNKDLLPTEIKIIDTENYSLSDAYHPTRGSTMKIKYNE